MTIKQQLPAQETVSKSYEQLFHEKTGHVFNEYYKKYYIKLVWIVQKMNINQIDAEDIANRAFMQSLNKIEVYNPQYQYSTWLFDIGKKMAYQFKKDEKKAHIYVDMSEPDERSDDFNTINAYLRTKIDSYDDNVLDTSEITKKKYDITMRVISNLKPIYKDIIELSDIQGRTYNEICQIMNVDLQTVKNRLHHGRKKIEGSVRDTFKRIEKELY